MLTALPKIRPITDLKKTSEISEFCHSIDEPVLITKNGYSDLVIMSVETYERERLRQEVYLKLAEAEAEFQAGSPTISPAELVQKLQGKIHAKTQD